MPAVEPKQHEWHFFEFNMGTEKWHIPYLMTIFLPS